MRSDVPRSVVGVLDRALVADADREALVTRTRRLTYAELDRAAHRAAQALRAMGLGPGDRVAASLANEAEIVVAFHGAMRIGAVWVGINRALAPPEKAYLLDDSDATLFLCDDAVSGVDRRVVTVEEWRQSVAEAPPEPVGTEVDPFAPAGIAYTSGTTGRPKGAVHSQWNLLLPGAALVADRGYGPDLRKGDCLPLTILNMVVLTTLLTAQAGGCSVVMDRIDPEGVAQWLRDEAVTVWNGPPATLHGLAHDDAVAAEDLATVEEVWTGGADCPEAVRDPFERKFAKVVLATYGLSEAPAVVSIDPVGGPHVAGSSGRPLPHLRVRIAGDGGASVPSGETGEICVGPADDRYRLMLGYWRRPSADAGAMAGGELHTGDLGYLDGAGNVVVRDRKSLVIIRGGANVYPAEVERVMHEAPGVAACAVFGVPDERLGQRVAAAVEMVAGVERREDSLRAHCLANLARYKVPERFVIVEALPRNAMGKVVRSELTALL